MKTKTIKIKDYNPHPANPNTHPKNQVEELGESLDRFGQFKNIVVWNSFILAGHGLVSAAKKKGLSTIDAVDVSHLSEDDAKALMVADNRLPELAAMDDEALKIVLDSIEIPTDIPGIDEEFLNSILEDISLDEQPGLLSREVQIGDSVPAPVIKLTVPPGVWVNSIHLIKPIIENLCGQYGIIVEFKG